MAHLSSLALAALNRGPALTYLRTPAGEFVYASGQTSFFLGAEADDVVGKPVLDYLAPNAMSRQRWSDYLKQTREGEFEHCPEIEVQGAYGHPCWVEVQETLTKDDSTDPPRELIAGVMVDITSRRLREGQLLEAQRLENLGLLSAGIAHDLNNVLAPILISGSLLKPLAANDRQKRMVEILQASAERGSRIVRQILNFAHGSDTDRILLCPRHVLNEVLLVVRETFPRSIMVEEDIARDLMMVHANPTQLHQLLLNLCVNARDAMSDGGTLTIRATNQLITEPPAGVTIISNRENWIRITITDTGSGIPPEQLEEIWAPFYTTKKQGHGTGLGLSTVRSLVSAHGGFVTLESKPDIDTTFHVHLPALDEPGDPLSESNRDEPIAEATRSETLLVVDDEPSMRAVIRDTLGQHGYQIILASDGVEALATLNLTQDKIDLIITDVHMPHLAGDVLVNVVKHLYPHLPVLAISGHPDAANTWKSSPHSPPDSYLHKPFTGQRLAQEVRALLDQRSDDRQDEGS